MALRIHALCLALNEEVFISQQMEFLYPFCSGISVLTQYDRDWYDRRVPPDATVSKVLAHPDPEGKIHLVVRRWRDETAARNQEMLSLLGRPHAGVTPHAVSREALRRQHAPPDYFMIVDADDFFDVDEIEGVLDYLERTRPRALRMYCRNYIHTWNTYIVPEEAPTGNFVFARPGLLFERWRIPRLREFAWNGFRYNVPRRWWKRRQRVMAALGICDLVERSYGFAICPPEVGVLHHAQWIGHRSRIDEKLTKSSVQVNNDPRFVEILEAKPTVHVATEDLPRNIREWEWPPEFFEDGAAWQAPQSEAQSSS